MIEFIKNRRNQFTLLTLLGPLIWYSISCMLPNTAGAEAVCVISGLLTSIYFGLRTGHLWDWFD